MSSPDSVKTLQQSDIIFRASDYAPGFDGSGNDSSVGEDEGEPEGEILKKDEEEAWEEIMRLCRGRAAYIGYVGHQKGNLQESLMDKEHLGLTDVEDALTTICDNIFSEIKRLQEHPDLFPSRGTRESFEKWIECERNLYEVAATNTEAESNIVSSCLKGIEKRNKLFHGPYFKPTLKPWHQFLHNGAPGALSVACKPKLGSGQIVPPGGVHLTGVWRCENKYLMKKRNVDPKERTRKTAVHKYATIIKADNGNIRHTCYKRWKLGLPKRRFDPSEDLDIIQGAKFEFEHMNYICEPWISESHNRRRRLPADFYLVHEKPMEKRQKAKDGKAKVSKGGKTIAM
ncbi:hypothetical protein MMC30_003030 [Trapelia coarctata]|nr:hypothetical protein [Trapelia coarctata]